MFRRRFEIGLPFVVLFAVSGCFTPNFVRPRGDGGAGFTGRGTTLGALSGGGLGALVGEVAADRPLAGAAIGATVGALTGNAVGSALDDVDAGNQIVQASGQTPAMPLQTDATSIDEVVAMSQAGLSENVISNQIRAVGFVGPLTAAELIHLRNQGVTDSVIATLQAESNRAAATVAAPEMVEPVVLEEYVVPPPRPYFYYRQAVRPRRYYPSPVRRPPPRPGVHLGMSFRG